MCRQMNAHIRNFAIGHTSRSLLRRVFSSTSTPRTLGTAKMSIPEQSIKPEPLCMFIMLRKDLQKSMEWPTGSIVTQGCHATAAVLHTHRNDPDVSAYLDNLDSMHKVAYELKNQSHLDKACQILDENGIIYYRWTEQPENIPTCLATKPYLRSDIADVLKKCKVSLYR